MNVSIKEFTRRQRLAIQGGWGPALQLKRQLHCEALQLALELEVVSPLACPLHSLPLIRPDLAQANPDPSKAYSSKGSCTVELCSSRLSLR